jgi:hypothetical protein
VRFIVHLRELSEGEEERSEGLEKAKGRTEEGTSYLEERFMRGYCA